MKACADGNAAALDAGLDAVRAMLTIANVSYAEKVAEDMLENLTTKGLGGRPKAAERATECCMLLIELEQCDAVLDALLKASLNRIPKLALAATNAVLMAVTSFGTPKVVPASAILKGLAPLFDAKDAKVRSTAKDITVEMTKWLGAHAVKRDLIDKMREAMQADVNKAISSVEANARPTRFLRKDQAAQDSAMASTSGDDGSAVLVQKPSRDTETTTTTAPVAAPDAYDYSEPESILPLLEKPGEGENPKFWDGIVSKKWQERLYALQTLTKLASAPKLSSGDYGDVSKALKQVITKDSNVACIAEAAPGQGRQHKKQRAHPPRPQSPMPFVVDETPYTYDDDEEDFKSVNIHVDDSYDRLNRVGEVKRTADALAQESYRRRMDVYGQVRDDFGTSFHFPTPEIVRPDHSPDPAVAGSCLLYYPTANARKQDKEGIPESPEEPTEATHRAASWKDEARRLHYSRSKSKSSTGVTLPTWVLEQYMEEHNQILCGDL